MFEKFKNTISDFFGSKSELTESTQVMIEERLSSPFYGFFALSWFIINWDFVYSVFFIDQAKIYEKFGLLRNEYIFQHILPSLHGKEWFLHFLIEPFLLTFLFFWIAPYITRPFYKKYIDNQKQLKKIELLANKMVVIEKTELIKAEVQEAEAMKVAEDVSPEIIWQREFDKFRKTLYFSGFREIRDCIYKYGGKVLVRGEYPYSEPEFQINTDLLAYVDSNNLINTRGDTISLTDKGKYFMKQFSEDIGSLSKINN